MVKTALVKIVPLFFFAFGAFATIEDAKDGRRKLSQDIISKLDLKRQSFSRMVHLQRC